MRLYLAHPLPARKEIREWEKAFEQRTGIELFNPFYDTDRDDIERIDSGIIVPRSMKKRKDGLVIVDRDLHQIEHSDGVVAYMIKQSMSVGTPMEVFYSSRILKKPTYVITEDFGGHPWVRGLATRIFKSKEKFEEWIMKH